MQTELPKQMVFKSVMRSAFEIAEWITNVCESDHDVEVLIQDHNLGKMQQKLNEMAAKRAWWHHDFLHFLGIDHELVLKILEKDYNLYMYKLEKEFVSADGLTEKRVESMQFLSPRG